MLTRFDVPASFFVVNNNMRLHICNRILSYEKAPGRNCSGRRTPADNRWRRHNSHSGCGHRPEYRCREEYLWVVLPPLFRLPSTRCTAWKYKSVRGYWKSDFLGVYMSVEIFKLCSQHVSQYSRGKSCCVGVDQEKQRIRA